MTPVSEAFREGVLALPRRLWGRAPQAAEAKDDSDPDSDLEDEEDEDPAATNTPDMMDLPSVPDELKRQIEGEQGSNINQAQPINGLFPFPQTRTPLEFHTIGPDAPVLNLTPSTPSPTPQPSSSATTTTSAQLDSSVTTAPAPVLPSSNALAASSTLSSPTASSSLASSITTGVSSAPTTVSTQAETDATGQAAATGGVNGGQVAGAAVGGVGKLALAF